METKTKEFEGRPASGGTLDVSMASSPNSKVHHQHDLALPSNAGLFEYGKLPANYWRNCLRMWQSQWYIVIGNIFEWYEFSIYGYLAAQKNVNFFRGNTDYTWAVFALTFIMRPIGAIFFGWMGDVHGRRISLLVSMIGMTVATFIPGCLPTYLWGGDVGGKIGLVGLIIARTLQGFCVGGEIGTGSATLSEIEQKQLLGAASGNVIIGSYTGALVAMLVVNALATNLTPDQMNMWGWRIPYLVTIVPGVISIIYRRHLAESHAFEQEMGTKEERRKIARKRMTLIIDVFRQHPRQALATLLGVSGFAASTYVAGIWGLQFVREFGKATAKDTQTATVISLVLSIVFTYFAFPLADMYGVGKVMTVYIVLALPYTILVWVGMTSMLDNRTACFGWIVSTSLMKILSGYSVQLYWIAELFPTHLRVTSYFCYNFTFALFGGVGPLICNAIVRKSIWGPMIFCCLAALVSTVSVCWVQWAHTRGVINAANIRPEKY